MDNQLLTERLKQLQDEYVSSLDQRKTDLLAVWDNILAEREVPENLKQMHHILHNLSGTGATYGFKSISSQAHAIEIIVKLIQGENALINDKIRDQIEIQIKNLAHELTYPSPSIIKVSGKPAIPSYKKNQYHHLIVFIGACRELYERLDQSDYHCILQPDIPTFMELYRYEQPSVVFLHVSLQHDPEQLRNQIQQFRSQYRTSLQAFCAVTDRSAEAIKMVINLGLEGYITEQSSSHNILSTLDNLLLNVKHDEAGRVLIMEEDPLMLHYYQTLLQEYGMVAKGDCEQYNLLSLITSFVPDVVLIDAESRIAPGLTAEAFALSNMELSSIPKVVILSKQEANARMSSECECMNDVLLRPALPCQIRNIVHMRAEAHQRWNELRSEFLYKQLLYEQTINRSDDILWLAEPETAKLLFITDNCSQLLPNAKDQFLGNPYDWKRFLGIEPPIDFLSEFENLYTRKELELSYEIKANGSFIPIIETIKLLFDPQGNPIGILGRITLPR